MNFNRMFSLKKLFYSFLFEIQILMSIRVARMSNNEVEDCNTNIVINIVYIVKPL